MHKYNPETLARTELINSFSLYFSIKRAGSAGGANAHPFRITRLRMTGGGKMPGARGGTSAGNQNDLSEIINGRLYVSNVDTLSKKFESQQEGALVVSCSEWHEVRSLPEQIVKSGARHFMLAMEDVSGAVDNIEHVVDALLLMKSQYDAGKPSYVHCTAGIGRSVMITYSFVSYLYLCNDPVIKPAIDEDRPLDPASEEFLTKLTERAFDFVAEVRGCSQFDIKVNVSRAALNILRERLIDPRALSEKRTPKFEFFAALVQLPSFKELITAGPCTTTFLQRLLKQDLNGWDEELEAGIKAEKGNFDMEIETNKMRKSGIYETLKTFPNKTLLQKFQADLQHLRDAHPNAVLEAELTHEKQARV